MAHYTTLLLSTLLVGTALAQRGSHHHHHHTKCMGPKDCLYPNPDSCTTYIQCVPLDEVGNAKPVVKPCPKGLQWNDNVGKKWCDYPNLSTCPVEAAAKEAAAKEAAAKEAAAKAMWKDVLKKIGTVALHAGKAALGAVADTISQ
nr:DrsB1-CBD [synthetic construct]